MNNLDQFLYDYLIDSIPTITDKWLSKRKRKVGSIYSADSDKTVEIMLREQNTLTNQTVASALLDDQQMFNKNVEHWASTVAESRVKSDTPIFEVIDAVNIAEYTFLEFVNEFINSEGENVSKEDVIRWYSLVNYAFNELKERFIKMYYELTRQRLFSQQVLIDELSIPIIPITDTVAILPLNGNVDTLRMKEIYDTLPNKVVGSNIEHLFIDLSGIPVMDEFVGQQIIQVVKMLKVLGVNPALSGIRPGVAQSIAQFQKDFTDLPTYSTLKVALQSRTLSIN